MSIQVATVNFTLTEVAVGEPVDLSLCTMVVGSPNGAQPLFFINPTAGLTHTYDVDTTTLTVTAANPGDTLEVVIQVFGSAGLLASSTDNMVTIVDAPAAVCP